MEITINESEAKTFKGGKLKSIIRHYWDPLPEKKGVIKKITLQKALINDRNYLEISVQHISDPTKVELTHKFKKRPLLADEFLQKDTFIIDNRVVDGIAFTNILSTVKLAGTSTVFRFIYPIKKLLALQDQPIATLQQPPVVVPGGDWYYTLGKTDEVVSLFICFKVEFPGPGGDTVSSGVKIPGGR